MSARLPQLAAMTVSGFRRVLAAQSGASAVEYGLLVAVIAVMLIGGAIAVGTAIGDDLFRSLAEYFARTLES